eukprot:627376-Rhodomonas_salina.1
MPPAWPMPPPRPDQTCIRYLSTGHRIAPTTHPLCQYRTSLYQYRTSHPSTMPVLDVARSVPDIASSTRSVPDIA